MLPSGWGAVAVAATDRSDWPVVLASLTGLAVLSVLLLGAWARLLPVTMRRSGGRASSARSATATGQPAAWERLLPASPTGDRLVRITSPSDKPWGRVEVRASRDDRDPLLLIDV